MAYQEQLLQLIDERCQLERQLGENQARIEQALLLIGALEGAEGANGRPRLVVSDRSDPTTIDAVREVITEQGPIEFYDLMTALRQRNIETSSKSVRAMLVKLCNRGKIRRVRRGTYAVTVHTAIA